MNIPGFILLILWLLLASPFVYLIGHVGKRLGRVILAQRAALLALGVAWIPLWIALTQWRADGTTAFFFGSLALQFDSLSLLFSFIVLLLGTLVVFYSASYLTGEEGQEKFYAMVMVLVGVMIGLACATDLFNLWIWYEAMAVTSFLLVVFYRTRPASLEAGIKYLVQSAVGSVFVLLGISLVLSLTGTTEMAEIRMTAEFSNLLVLAGILFVVGYGVKTALVPLHTWLPDAHSQAPSGISAMLSGVVIEGGLIALLRSVSPLTSVTSIWGPMLIGFGLLNMIIGNLLAYDQKNVKRMLAYSSITHIGYMLTGLGVAFLLQNSSGAEGGFFHMFNHALMKGLAFLSAGVLLYAVHISLGDHRPLLLNDLAGASRKYPLAALALSLALLSLAGLPPFAGFMSKWQIMSAGLTTTNPFLWIVGFLVALNSIFSLTYYAPVVNVLYRREPSEAVNLGHSLPVSMALPLVLLMVGVVIIGIWPSLIGWLTGSAGEVLLAGIGG
jgi:proton-translocating NADH-quinone oxidoreductase chain N